MSRYINADELEDELYEHEFSNWCDKDEVSELIDNTPTADVVDVVRCKDCKYAEIKDNGVLRKTAYCHRLNVSISGKGEGYCYLGERKDGEEQEHE